MIYVTPSTGLTLTKGISAENSAAIESFEKMTAAVMGREKMVLNNLVNNNNVKSRVTQISKREVGWKPPQTFAVGFWANREKSGSTLTLFDDIVSSDSEDECETAPSSAGGRRTSGYHPSPAQLGKRASVDSRTSYKYAMDKGPINMSNLCNHNISATPNLPPENKSVNKMQYCQEWLKPQQQQPHVPIIGNVGTGNYNRLQSTSKWDARNKLPHASTTFSSSVKTTTVVNIYNSVQKTRRSETVLRPTQLYPTSSFPTQNNNENARPDSQMSNRSSDSSHSSGGRRSRPSSICSVGSAGSRPTTPSYEQRGPPMSPNLRSKPMSPSATRKYSSQSSINSPTHTGRQVVNSPGVISSHEVVAERMRRMSGNRPMPPLPAPTMERSNSTEFCYPVQRSNSADSIQLDRRASSPSPMPSPVYKTEVHLSITSPFSTPKPDHHIPPIPVPRRSVGRTKSSVTPRPHTMHHNMLYSHQEMAADYQNIRRISTGSLHSQQQSAAADSSDSDDSDDDVAATNVNFFNVNAAAVVTPKPAETATELSQDNAAELQKNQRNLQHHQPESTQNNTASQLSSVKAETKKSHPEIAPRGFVESTSPCADYVNIIPPPPDYVNVTPPTNIQSSQSDNVNTTPVVPSHPPVATAQTYLRESSPIYDNLIPYNNNQTPDHQSGSGVYENISIGSGQSSRASSVEKECLPLKPPQHLNQGLHSSWDNISLSVIEFQTQCAQVCTLPSHHS